MPQTLTFPSGNTVNSQWQIAAMTEIALMMLNDEIDFDEACSAFIENLVDFNHTDPKFGAYKPIDIRDQKFIHDKFLATTYNLTMAINSKIDQFWKKYPETVYL